jgi:hypothetical protein
MFAQLTEEQSAERHMLARYADSVVELETVHQVEPLG